MAEEKPVKKKKKIRKIVPEGRAYITATYNNTIVTITDLDGNVLGWSSAGASGFKGTRKSTPYAASIAAQNAATSCKLYGLEKVQVLVKGVGSGREQSIRSLQANGIQVLSIADVTPIPHNGCRRPKPRRV